MGQSRFPEMYLIINYSRDEQQTCCIDYFRARRNIKLIKRTNCSNKLINNKKVAVRCFTFIYYFGIFNQDAAHNMIFTPLFFYPLNPLKGGLNEIRMTNLRNQNLEV